MKDAVGSAGVTPATAAARGGSARHEGGVEGGGHVQAADSRTRRGDGQQRVEAGEQPGGDHLPRAVAVGRGQPVPVEGAQHLVEVTTEHGGHA